MYTENGIRRSEQIDLSSALRQKIMGEDWVSPNNFRIGSARLLDDLLGVLDGARLEVIPAEGY